MQQQKQPAPRAKMRRHAASRPDFIAAVRYHDGRSELIRVRNADDVADARQLVFAELMDVRSVVIASAH